MYLLLNSAAGLLILRNNNLGHEVWLAQSKLGHRGNWHLFSIPLSDVGFVGGGNHQHSQQPLWPWRSPRLMTYKIENLLGYSAFWGLLTSHLPSATLHCQTYWTPVCPHKKALCQPLFFHFADDSVTLLGSLNLDLCFVAVINACCELIFLWL